MDVKEKRKALIEYCDRKPVCNGCVLHIANSIQCDFDTAPDEQIEIWHAKAFPEKVHTASLNYEAEYHKLLAENAMLKNENSFMAMNLQDLRQENDILREKLDMVYLIFGGRNHA